MKVNLRKETNPEHLREMLTQCESEIENLAKDYRAGKSYFRYKKPKAIRENLELRADILDRLFELHFNDSDSERLSQVNAMLETHENTMVAKHIDTYRKLKAIDNNYKLESYLLYRHHDDNPRLQALEDDGYYGSNWEKMMSIIDKAYLLDNMLFECSDEGHTVYDDGWRGSIRASFSIAPDIKPCYTIWELINYQGYSIPDVLQMTSYYYVFSADAMIQL